MVWLIWSSLRTSVTTRVRPAACNRNTSARSSRVPTIEPITDLPLEHRLENGQCHRISPAAGNPTQTSLPPGRREPNA